MAYMGYCVKCNYMYSTVSCKGVEQTLLDHMFRCHADNFEESDIRINRISAQAFREFLMSRDNPNFWKAWNNRKKPLFV